MKVSYDKRGDTLVLAFKEGRISKDQKIGDGVFAGYDREGNLMEIIVESVSEREAPWISLEAAATILKRSTRTLHRWIEAGKINPPKVGRDYRLTAEMVTKLAGETEEEAPPAKKVSTRRK